MVRCWLTMIEKDAPKLCNRLHSRLNSCVYPNSASRPSSCILKLTSGVAISGCPVFSIDRSVL